jgi:hypothetical protein
MYAINDINNAIFHIWYHRIYSILCTVYAYEFVELIYQDIFIFLHLHRLLSCTIHNIKLLSCLRKYEIKYLNLKKPLSFFQIFCSKQNILNAIQIVDFSISYGMPNGQLARCLQARVMTWNS